MIHVQTELMFDTIETQQDGCPDPPTPYFQAGKNVPRNSTPDLEE